VAQLARPHFQPVDEARTSARRSCKSPHVRLLNIQASGCRIAFLAVPIHKLWVTGTVSTATCAKDDMHPILQSTNEVADNLCRPTGHLLKVQAPGCRIAFLADSIHKSWVVGTFSKRSLCEG
jgi:hypothetical protein